MDAKDAGDEKERQRCHCQLYVIFSGSLKYSTFDKGRREAGGYTVKAFWHIHKISAIQSDVHKHLQ